MKSLYISVAAVALSTTAGFAAADMMADANNDGYVTQEEAMAAYPGLTAEQFNDIDRNGDDRLTSDEIQMSDAQQVLDQYMPDSQSAMPVDVASIDTNGDGFVSQDELMAAYPGLTKEDFNTIDANGDDRIDSNELLAENAQPVLNQETGMGAQAATIAMFDTNGDGYASEAEVSAVFPSFTNVDFNSMDENKDSRLSADEIQNNDAQDVLKRYM